MMPTFISTTENAAAGGLSNVGSGEFEMRTSDWSRMIDIRHTLQTSSVEIYPILVWMYPQSSKCEHNHQGPLLSFLDAETA